MLIRRVTAHAFGPLAEASLEFADGMTVIYGENESAKSSWHAATYAALCGRRRGASTTEDRRFEARHRPWDRREWLVSAQVLLDDGRRVELRQDLAGRVDCHAKDLDLGTDLSGEVLADGMPDGARWLGLDRASFAATACIAQAKMLSILDGADGLQEHLQRAAATAGTDATAAVALEQVAEHRRIHVGSDRANSGRPLRSAIDATRRARVHLEQARARRTEYENRQAEVESVRAEAASAEWVLRLHEAVAAKASAARLRERADEVVELDARLAGAEPPRADDDAVSQEVLAALAAWRARVEVPVDMDAGLTLARRGVSDREIWELARRLELSVPPADPVVTGRVMGAQERLARAEQVRNRARLLAMAGAASCIAGAGLFCLGGGALALAWAGLVVGVGMLGAAVVTGSASGLASRARGFRGETANAMSGSGGETANAMSGSGGETASFTRRPGAELAARPGWFGGLGRAGVAVARAELEAARVAEAAGRQTSREMLAQRRMAEARCAELGVPADPRAMRNWARAQAGGARDQQWRTTLERAQVAAAERVLAAARRCGVAATTVEEAVQSLQRWDQDRSRRAAEISQARQLWARRTALLDGRTVADLVAEADATQELAERAADGFSDEDLAAVTTVEEGWLRELRAVARTSAVKAIAAEGSLMEHASGLPPVTEAEEELARAEAELARVRDLDETLELTRRFLTSAQERAHRDIAPALAESVRRALPELTAGRYTDVIVDPRTLRVEVCGPERRWRAADRLSHGTAEQVFLLLRIALAGRLVMDKTSCPLLLDDITVHADGQRAVRILELLRRTAAERQIILFTQQEQVRDWARARLDADRDALHELSPVPSV
jgi:exonuclease SbcC